MYGPGERRRGRGGWASHLFLVVLAVLLTALVIWVIAGLVFTVLRLFELFAVAFVAGWIGYHLGSRRRTR